MNIEKEITGQGIFLLFAAGFLMGIVLWCCTLFILLILN
ncbi:hypothetical protein LLB_3525 [Legionella longbeachae D-4968]|nr:hypothetical protein LLB_3525 [Legionella longbeachae D-4968]